ncbi:hypothetical protein [Cryobacterium tepidiphilum]|uniref:DoxX family protein n=1 Tax=Cryobacterium tepidiphilum TaxID=2486026 RepID=A0A3M8LHC7_9MICO|nr:hypothetical protein [Cryobacterium tepidiphilum]RNE64024.1 hypothetical protein EEJ31_05515 [Cryobacterium tepidiphilum]
MTQTQTRAGNHVKTGRAADEPAIASVLTWPLAGRPAHSAWRLVAAAGAITEAVAHIPVIEDHFSEAPYVGVLFALVTVAGFLLAILLLTADSRAVWVSTLVVSALALAAYVLSRTVGLPQIDDDIGHWADALGTMAIVGEAVMLVSAVAHILSPRWRSRPAGARVEE